MCELRSGFGGARPASGEAQIERCLISGAAAGGASWPHTSPWRIRHGCQLSRPPQGGNGPVKTLSTPLGTVKSTSKETSDSVSVRRRSLLAEAATVLISQPPPV